MAFREPVMSEHAKKVLRWRESFLYLDENRFSETMRTYLGEIKTPYNKQKLVESLESFLRQKEHLVAIKSLVSKEELDIICAAVFIPDCTEDKLTKFFENTYSYSFLYETINNLEDRLILFISNIEDHFIIEFNPLLEDAFYDLISVEKLLPEIHFEKKQAQNTIVTAEMIAAFCAFVIQNPNLAKQDRSLKKHTIEVAEEIFGEKTSSLTVLFNGFLNLGILKDSGKGVEFDWSKMNKFVQQSLAEQLVYITVASSGHFSRDNLRLQAQLLIDTLRNLGSACFTKDLFLRTGFLAAARPKSQEETRPQISSRFARLIEESRLRTAGQDVEATRISENGGLERMFDAAVVMGLVSDCGTTDSGETVYTFENIFDSGCAGSAADAGSERGAGSECSVGSERNLCEMLTVDPGMSVNIMPGFALKDIIPVIKFMSVTRYDMVSSYSIDRQSIMRGFDFGLTSKSILAALKERTAYPVPETLEVQLDDWNASYSSAEFFKGFVLKLDGKMAIAAEHNSVLAPHIHTVIAPGIFLLDINDDAEAMALIKESGLDFVGKIKTARAENQSTDFLKLNLEGRKINDRSGFTSPAEVLETEDAEKVTDRMYAALAKLKLAPAAREGLELRIIHKMVINPSQLNPSILRMERTNAGGMDFGGKLYIIDLAMKSQEKIEMKFGAGGLTVVGVPLNVTKKNAEAFVEIQLEPDNVVREYSIGKASSVSRIRKGMFRY